MSKPKFDDLTMLIFPQTEKQILCTLEAKDPLTYT